MNTKHWRRMLRAAFIVGVLCTTLGAQTSQPPTPSGPKGESSPPSEQAKPDDVRGTPGSPAVVQLLPIPKTPEQAAQEQAESRQQATTDRWTIGLTFALVLCTIGLIVVGWFQRGTYAASLATNREIERAYVDISHEAGLVLQPNIVPNISFVVKNHGRTPADVLRVSVSVIAKNRREDLPAIPPYANDDDVTHALLMHGESMRLSGDFTVTYGQAAIDAFGAGTASYGCSDLLISETDSVISTGAVTLGDLTPSNRPTTSSLRPSRVTTTTGS